MRDEVVPEHLVLAAAQDNGDCASLGQPTDLSLSTQSHGARFTAGTLFMIFEKHNPLSKATKVGCNYFTITGVTSRLLSGKEVLSVIQFLLQFISVSLTS